jgi:hypothetical protein
MDTEMEFLVFPIIWGFLVGFVGWESLPRLVKPWTAWLLERTDTGKGKDIGFNVAKVLVALFLLFAMLAAIYITPFMFRVISHGMIGIEHLSWSGLYGVCFVSSWIGFLTLRLLMRIE